VASIVAMVIGAFGPWASVLGVITINGTDDGNDGWIVVGAAVVGAIVLGVFAWRLWRWVLVVALLAGLAGAVTAGYDINNISNLSSDDLLGSGLTSKKWGIYLSLVASISLALASIGVFVESRRAQAATPDVA
jgi:hypothetical protein